MTAASARAAHPGQQALATGPPVRQDGPVDPLGAEDADAADVSQLTGREGLGWPERHVPGVVRHDVDAALLTGDGRDHRVDRILVLDVHLGAADVNSLAGRQLGELVCRFGVAPAGGAHARVHGGPGPGQGPGGEVAEAAGGAGNHDDLRFTHVQDSWWKIAAKRAAGYPPCGSEALSARTTWS